MAACADLGPLQHGEMEEHEASAMLDADTAPAPRRGCGRGRGVGISIVAMLLAATFARRQWPGDAPKNAAMSSPAPERFPILYGGSVEGDAEPDLDAPAAVIRKLIESEYTWEDESQSDAQCTIDVINIASFLTRQIIGNDCAPEGAKVNASALWPKHHGAPISGKEFWSKHPLPAFVDGKKPTVPPKSMRKFPTSVGRRLNGTVASFLAKAGDAHKKLAEKKADEKWRGESIALCTVDVVQTLNYIGYSVFLLHSATLSCPDASACPVDIFNAIASIAWVGMFTTNTMIDCPLKPLAGALCARDIIALTAGTANLVASAMSLATDCNNKK